VVSLPAALLPGAQRGATVGQDRADDVPYTRGSDTLPMGRYGARLHNAILRGTVVLSAL